jgi:hypothetical protein
MDLPLWAQIPATVESYAKIAAILFGDGRAVYRFGLGREPALAIDIDHTEASTPSAEKLVTFRVTCPLARSKTYHE